MCFNVIQSIYFISLELGDCLSEIEALLDVSFCYSALSMATCGLMEDGVANLHKLQWFSGSYIFGKREVTWNDLH